MFVGYFVHILLSLVSLAQSLWIVISHSICQSWKSAVLNQTVQTSKIINRIRFSRKSINGLQRWDLFVPARRGCYGAAVQCPLAFLQPTNPSAITRCLISSSRCSQISMALLQLPSVSPDLIMQPGYEMIELQLGWSIGCDRLLQKNCTPSWTTNHSKFPTCMPCMDAVCLVMNR